MWCGSPEHLIVAYPPKIEGYRQGLPPLRHAAVGMAYVLSKKEAATFGMVVDATLFLISKPFCVLVDSVTTHSSPSIYMPCN